MSRYCFTDIHSRYDLLTQILNYAKPNDELYFLGDIADRGPEPWKCISAIMSDPRATWIMGNHDKFFLMLPEIVEGYCPDQWLWAANGGDKTIEECLSNLSEDGLKSFCSRIRKLPQRIDLTREDGATLILTHAGLSPEISDADYRAVHGVKSERYLWDREHINLPWRGGDNTWVIHGHTPVPYLEDLDRRGMEAYEQNPYIKVYADGHKIDLDTGAVWTSTAALFNLDTFEVKYFTAKEEEDDNS